jgi:hypothetical protein
MCQCQHKLFTREFEVIHQLASVLIISGSLRALMFHFLSYGLSTVHIYIGLYILYSFCPVFSVSASLVQLAGNHNQCTVQKRSMLIAVFSWQTCNAIANRAYSAHVKLFRSKFCPETVN